MATALPPQPVLLVLIASLLMVAACRGGGSAQGGGGSGQGGVESALRAVAAGNDAPAELSVVYDDMHGLWGGQMISLAGGGAYERQERGRGGSAPTVITGTVDRQQI